MKISVVTVCLNSAKTIRFTVESFLRQSHADKELIVVDGLSSDDTLAIVRSYNAPQIRILSEKDAGIYDAMNKGLRLCSGDAVGVLNSDDCYRTDDALRLVAGALEHSDIAYGGTIMVSDQQTQKPVRSWRGGRFTPSALQMGWIPPHPSFFITRKILTAVGAFDTRYKIAADYDFMMRALLLPDVRVSEIPDFLVNYQLGGASSSSIRNIIRGNLECMDSRKRNLHGRPIDLALFLRPARRLSQFWNRSES